MVLSVIVALIVARKLDRHFSGAPVKLFLCAVMLSAWFGGVIPRLLAVALRFARRLIGRLSAVPNDGRGTTFHFTV